MSREDHNAGTSHNEELSDTVVCPKCSGTGEVERPRCQINDCGRKMVPRVNGEGWACPIHAGGMWL